MPSNNHLCDYTEEVQITTPQNCTCPENIDVSGVTQAEICSQAVVQKPCELVDQQNNFLALDKIKTFLCENTFVAGGNLTGQNITAFVPTLFTATGLTTVFAWSFKDSDGQFLELQHTAQNVNNTVIQVTTTDDLTGFDIYFYGQV
tara:strand:+ start:10108 stop:10545 length:438 start_codon:yes stop_codon:yes gene_type:complete